MKKITCAFCRGETRQQTTELQFKLKFSRLARKFGSNAYIKHFPSIIRANLGPNGVRKYCFASSRQQSRSRLTESLIHRAISTGSPWQSIKEISKVVKD